MAKDTVDGDNRQIIANGEMGCMISDIYYLIKNRFPYTKQFVFLMGGPE